MSVLRFFAVVLIFVVSSAAWCLLGQVTGRRTAELDTRLSREMESLWGPEVLAQPSPYWATSAEAARTNAGSTAPSASAVTADITHRFRYKGLLWYTTFKVAFAAEYTFAPAPRAGEGAGAGEAGAAPTAGAFVLPLPAGVSRYDEMRLTVDGEELKVPASHVAAGRIVVALDRAAEHVVSVGYRTYGRNVWLYAPGSVPDWSVRDGKRVFASGGPLVEMNNFSLAVTTDFDDIDYPSGTCSPNTPAAAGADNGRKAVWQFKENALTSQAMGVVVPTRPNAGPIVSRMSLFAPVSLLFFLTTLFTVVVLKRVALHPMHYLFISAGFFAFHILLAYLADVFVRVQLAFWLCAAVSVLLVVSYMRLVAGVKFAVAYVGLAQLVFLVGFSYAFFWEGHTGRAIVVGAILTLFVLMQATGRVKWSEIFKGRPPRPGPVLAAPAPAPRPAPEAAPPTGGGPPPPPKPPEQV